MVNAKNGQAQSKSAIVLLNGTKERAESKFNLSYLIVLDVIHFKTHTSEVCLISVYNNWVTKA